MIFFNVYFFRAYDRSDRGYARIDLAFSRFSRMFHFPVAEGQGSFFLGEKEIEIMKGHGRGEKGHLAFATNDVSRALFYLGRQGIRPVAGTEKEKDGKTILVYLDQEIAGFAIHLRQKG